MRKKGRPGRATVLAGAALAAAVAASTSLAGAAAPTERNGKLAYTAVVSALQIYAQSPGSAATRLLVSDSVDFPFVPTTWIAE